MHNFPIHIEVAAIAGDKPNCKGRAIAIGQSWETHVHTPAGMCARSFAMLYPYLLAMRFADDTPFERGKGYAEFVCPDGSVTFRLSRVIREKTGD